MPHSELRIAISGAGGFVGRAFADYFADRGYSVITLPRIPEEVLARPLDELANSAALGNFVALLNGCDALVNCAGRTGKATKTELELANEKLPAFLYHLSEQANVRCFIHLSSVAALASISEPGKPISDLSEPGPKTDYGKSKLAADRMLLATVNRVTRLVILRPPMLYGPNARGVFALFVKAARARIPLPIGKLTNKRNFVYIYNLADAVLAAIKRPRVSGCYLLTDSPPISPGDFYNLLSAASGGRRLAWKIPVAVLTPFVQILLGSRSESILANAVYSSNKFREDAEWYPAISVERAVEDTMGQV